jgi:hypothetical protein
MSERRNRRNRERREMNDVRHELTPWSTARMLRAERRAPLRAAYDALPASKREKWETSEVRKLALMQGEDIRDKQRARAHG